MEGNQTRKHILIPGYSTTHHYKYPKKVVVEPISLAKRDRKVHGERLLQELKELKKDSDWSEERQLPANIIRDDAIYVDFTSERGYLLKFESLEQDKKAPEFQILNIREEERPTETGQNEYRYHVTVMMTEGAVSTFVKKVQDYLNKNAFYLRKDTGNPQNNPLVSNIAKIQKATLRSFWVDGPEIPFPDEDELLWWEIWFRRTASDHQKIAEVVQNLEAFGVQIGISLLTFAEHYVRLVRGTASQLSRSLMLLDNLAELRKPQEIADFITHKDVTFEDHQEWMNGLLSRIDNQFEENNVTICLLDSGINNGHPLLVPFLPAERLYSYKPDAWGVYDSEPNGGHGTGMAGLALYGDLVDAMDSPHRIQILHGLESFKVIHHSDQNDPELYGSITEEACSTPLIYRPNVSRVFCMAITDKALAFRGRPSTWSSSIDKITFGTYLEPSTPQLFIVSGGNVIINSPNEYPDKNQLESIHDPGQAYNALTVGSYTRKDRLPSVAGYRPLAKNGAMAPSNSTSLVWDHQWPIKPDFVMEGGNVSTNDFFTNDHSAVKLLSLDKDFPQATFLPFGDTSAASALSARMAAQLMTAYPSFWPETIRALMVHSADWTTEMLGGTTFSRLGEKQKIRLLRSVGYGVPILEKALFSANNSLTLIAEREIQPYKMVGATGKYNHYHLFQLPWPSDILQETLGHADVTLKVTLSYFIEPNPGSKNRSYTNNFWYHSHSLDFAVIKPHEKLAVFVRRISAEADLPEDEANHKGEPWRIGRVRNRGSVKKDFITMSGADMAMRNTIAVYPRGGWYKTRKKLAKANSVVRYSLVVSIETERVDVDIYSAVFNSVEGLVKV